MSSRVRIVVSYGTATLRGVVKLENGSLPPEGRIFARLVRPGENLGLSMMQPPQVDARGQFIAVRSSGRRLRAARECDDGDARNLTDYELKR